MTVTLKSFEIELCFGCCDIVIGLMMQEETRDREFRSQSQPRLNPAQENACPRVLEEELDLARVLSMFEGTPTFQLFE
jgi:hypothetical protein